MARQTERTPKHTTVAAHLPGHVRELVETCAERTGHRSVSEYMAARLQEVALRDAMGGERPEAAA